MSEDFAHLTRMLRKPLQLNAKEGSRILIMTDTRMDPSLWQALQAAAHDLHMEPVVTIMDARATHSTNPPESIRQAALANDIDLCIYLTSTAMAHSSLTDEFIEKGKRFILME